MTKRDRVLHHLKTIGPATDEEMSLHLSIPGNTLRPRRIELVREGLIKETGSLKTTVAGRSATIWQAI